MLTKVSEPTVEPIDLATAKLHCKVDYDDDDALISAMITAARQKCESYLSRSFITTPWVQTLDGFPGQFSRFSPALGTFSLGSYGYGMGALYGYIPERLLSGTAEPITVQMARLIAVQSFTYQDPNTLEVLTLDPSRYNVEPGDGGRISPAYNTVWPTALVYPGSVVINLTMGYGPSPSNVPVTVIQAMLLYIRHLYENRSAVVIGNGITTVELPLGAKWLLASEDWGQRL